MLPDQGSRECVKALECCNNRVALPAFPRRLQIEGQFSLSRLKGSLIKAKLNNSDCRLRKSKQAKKHVHPSYILTAYNSIIHWPEHVSQSAYTVVCLQTTGFKVSP